MASQPFDALRRTVDELRSKLAEAPAVDRPGLTAAFAALARGDSLAAEEAFEREYEVQRRASAPDDRGSRPKRCQPRAAA
jgi:hypothetical protein